MKQLTDGGPIALVTLKISPINAPEAPWAVGPCCTAFKPCTGSSSTAAEGLAAHLASLDACRSPQVLHLAGRRLRRHQDTPTLLRRRSLTINGAYLGGTRPCLLVVAGCSCTCQCRQGMGCTKLQQAVPLNGPQPPALNIQCPAGVQGGDSWLHLFWSCRPCKCRARLNMQVRQGCHHISASRQAGLDSLSTVRVPQAASCAHHWCIKMLPASTRL